MCGLLVPGISGLLLKLIYSEGTGSYGTKQGQDTLPCYSTVCGQTTILIGDEAGRIRALYANGDTSHIPTGFAYDYFIKDHLGNIRMVLTEEQQQDIYPAATLEGDISNGNTAVAYENQF